RYGFQRRIDTEKGLRADHPLHGHYQPTYLGCDTPMRIWSPEDLKEKTGGHSSHLCQDSDAYILVKNTCISWGHRGIARIPRELTGHSLNQRWSASLLSIQHSHCTSHIGLIHVGVSRCHLNRLMTGSFLNDLQTTAPLGYSGAKRMPQIRLQRDQR